MRQHVARCHLVPRPLAVSAASRQGAASEQESDGAGPCRGTRELSALPAGRSYDLDSARGRYWVGEGMTQGDLEAVRTELQRLVAAPTMSRARALHLPLLVHYAGASDSDHLTAVLRMLEQEAAQLDEPAMSAAAAVLFFDEERWVITKLGRRQDRAGAQLDVHTKSGWTKKRRDGTPSYHDRLLTDLARRIIDRDVFVESVADETVPAEDRKPAGRALRRALAAATIGTVLAFGAIIAVTQRSDQPDTAPATTTTVSTATPGVTTETATGTATPPPTAATTTTTETADPPKIPCSVPLGAAGSILSPSEQAILAAELPSFQTLGFGSCGQTPVEPFGDGLSQKLVRDGGDDGVIIVAPGSHAVRLTRTQWASYREAAGRNDGQQTLDFAGYPISVTEEPTGTGPAVIELSAGGVLVGRTPNDPHFWVPQLLDARRRWDEEGGADGRLGLPTSNPFHTMALAGEVPWYDEGWYLEFEHGYMTASATLEPATVRTVIVADPLAPLQGLDVRGRVLSQIGDQSWFVDPSGAAHWIPDGRTWECLRGPTRLIADHVPGYTIAAFTPGTPATCDLAD